MIAFLMMGGHSDEVVSIKGRRSLLGMGVWGGKATLGMALIEGRASWETNPLLGSRSGGVNNLDAFPPVSLSRSLSSFQDVY